MHPSISRLLPDDRPTLIQLLSQSSLPTTDLPPQLLHFFKAEINGNLAGTVGLEIYDSYALLRSLVVDNAYRSQKIGQQLLDQALQYARSQGITEVYLITNTAEEYFEKQGFAKVERNSVPTPIQKTQQFQGVCPSSATVMYKAL